MRFLYIACVCFFLSGCTVSESNKNAKNPALDTQQENLLTKVQQQTFQYFWEGAEPNSGLARERIHIDGVYPENDQNVITIAGSGYGLMSILVGIHNNFISKEEGLQRLHKALHCLDSIPRFQGAWSHW